MTKDERTHNSQLAIIIKSIKITEITMTLK